MSNEYKKPQYLEGQEDELPKVTKQSEIVEEKYGDRYDNESISHQKEMRSSSGFANAVENTMGMMAETDQNSNNFTKIRAAKETNEDRQGAEEETEGIAATTLVEEEEAQGQSVDQTQLQDRSEGAGLASQPSMSKEEILLLQVLRRAKRQQDLIGEVQKSLKILSSIEKSIEKTTDQIKQLQAAVKITQKEITLIQRQIAGVERAQEKGFKRMDLAKQKVRTSSANKPKVRTGKGRKSGKSKGRQ